MDPVETLARTLAMHRLERDRMIAQEAGLPHLLKLDAYLPQCRKDAEAVLKHAKP